MLLACQQPDDDGGRDQQGAGSNRNVDIQRQNARQEHDIRDKRAVVVGLNDQNARKEQE